MRILLTQNQAAKKSGTNWYSVSRAVANGRVRPVAKLSNGGLLFEPDAVAEISDFIKSATDSQHNIVGVTA